jgi:hypothetical protein
VEFALGATLLVVVLVGTAQVGLLYYDGIAVDTAAREAVRVASENPAGSTIFAPNPNAPGSHPCTVGGDVSTDPNVVCQAAYKSTHSGTLGGLINPALLTVTITGSTVSGVAATTCSQTNAGSSDGLVTVTVSYNAPIFVPFVDKIFASPGQTYRTLTATVQIRVEPCNVTQGS